jgi:hypothetical protein
VLLDFLLPDGSEIGARAYAEATEGLLRDAETLVVPVGPGAAGDWPERVVGADGVTVRREGKPHERLPATVRWADAEEARALWPYARSARRGAFGTATDLPDDVRILVVDLHR